MIGVGRQGPTTCEQAFLSEATEHEPQGKAGRVTEGWPMEGPGQALCKLAIGNGFRRAKIERPVKVSCCSAKAMAAPLTLRWTDSSGLCSFL